MWYFSVSAALGEFLKLVTTIMLYSVAFESTNMNSSSIVLLQLRPVYFEFFYDNDRGISLDKILMYLCLWIVQIMEKVFDIILYLKPFDCSSQRVF